jgi:hypothetical protein
MHDAISSHFMERAVMAICTLSQAAQKEVITGTTEDVFSFDSQSLARMEANILLKFTGFRDSNMNIGSAKESNGYVALTGQEYPLIT